MLLCEKKLTKNVQNNKKIWRVTSIYTGKSLVKNSKIKKVKSHTHFASINRDIEIDKIKWINTRRL